MTTNNLKDIIQEAIDTVDKQGLRIDLYELSPDIFEDNAFRVRVDFLINDHDLSTAFKVIVDIEELVAKNNSVEHIACYDHDYFMEQSYYRVYFKVKERENAKDK